MKREGQCSFFVYKKCNYEHFVKVFFIFDKLILNFPRKTAIRTQCKKKEKYHNFLNTYSVFALAHDDRVLLFPLPESFFFLEFVPKF